MQEIRFKDFSEIDIFPEHLQKMDYFRENYGLPDRPRIENLGCYIDTSKEGKVRADRFVGLVPLRDRDDNIMTDYFISVAPRRGNAVSMLEKVMESNQVGDPAIARLLEPKYMKWNEWKEYDFTGKQSDFLYGIVSDAGEIELPFSAKSDGEATALVSDVQNVFEVAQYLQQLQEICRRALKQFSVPIEENLVGKVKGKIDINKQIRHNLAKGRKDRNYCIYNKMSIDNLENRVLKYALHLCKKWAAVRGDIFSEQIFYCDNVLKPVKLVRITKSTIQGIKCNNAYKDYKNAFDLATRLIDKTDVSFDANGNEQVRIRKVKPFFIRMDLLFELYCRAVTEKAIDRYNQLIRSKRPKLRLRNYSNNITYIFEDSGANPKGFQNENIADLVVESVDENKPYTIVMDAKYIPNFNGKGERERTHQLLAYMLLYQANACGFMHPTDNPSEKLRKKAMAHNSTHIGFDMPICEYKSDIEQLAVFFSELSEEGDIENGTE